MASDTQVLSENFLIELLKSCISNLNVLEVISKHLDEHHFPKEADNYRKLWVGIKNSFELTNRLPSVGILNERFKSNQEVLDLLLKVKNQKIPDIENIFPTFERYIKQVRFVSLYKQVGELWNREEEEEAMKLLAVESNEINAFSLREGLHAKVFKDYEDRNEKRKNKIKEELIKVPFGIHPLDFYSRGGVNIGTSALFLGRSGVGKTTLLRWIGINAARQGLKGVHFQIEGSEQECMDAYDAAWIGEDLENIEFGAIPKEKILKLRNVNKDIIRKGGEVFVIAPEQFDSLSIESCRENIEELEKRHGKISFALFDNLELFTVKGKFPNSEQGERKRREEIANKITNLSVMYKMAVIATTQANDLRPEKFNSPDFVMTRSDINEFKNLLKPFSFFATINQTIDEYDAEICRIYIDKMRKYRSNITMKICQSMSNSRFYNSGKTLNTFWNASENKPL